MNNRFYDSKEEYIYLIAYSLWMVDALIGITMWRQLSLVNTLGNYLQKIGYILLLMQFCVKKKYTRRDVIGILMILLSGILAYHAVYNRHIIATMILIYFSANVDYRKILKCTLIIQAAFMLVTISASQLKVIEDVIWQQGNERVRQSLGYDYCAYPAHILLFMTLSWFCIREKTRLLEVTLILGLNTVIYILTDSRADYYLSLLATFGFCLVCRFRTGKTHRIFEFVMKYGCGMLAAFSIGLHYFYSGDNPTMARLNTVLSARLSLGQQAIQQYGFSAFGKVIRWFGQGSLRNNPERVYNYVDCAFLKELLSFGVVFLIVLVVAFYFVGKQLVREKNYVLGWGVTISLLYAVVNAHLCMVAYNVFILVLGGVFRVQKDEITSEEVADRQHLLGIMQNCADEFFTERGKSVLRTALFFLIFLLTTYVQRLGLGQMVSNESMYRWIICLILFLLAGLTYEYPAVEKERKNYFLYVVTIFLVLAMISDIFVDKKFQYAAFFTVLFWGLLVQGWKSMEDPENLMKDLKRAYKFYFVMILAGGILSRKTILGFGGCGLFLTAAENAMIMLAALVFFLDDVKLSWPAIFNVGGALMALFVLYTTKQTILILTGIGIVLVYLIVLCYKQIKGGAARGAGIILIAIVVLGCIALAGGFLWKLHSAQYFEILKIYLKNANLLGHNYVPRYQNVRSWTESSVAINTYRYGILAGCSFLLAELGYFVTACWQMIKKKSFLQLGLAIAILVVNETVITGLPFVHVGWLLLVLGMSYALADI